MAAEPTARVRRLGPDELAELEEQRSFLLRSLDDLEAELAAGDIDEADHAALRDDYTRRAAEVLRAIDAGKAAIRSAAPPRSRARTAVVLVGALAVATIAGFLLARSVGFRGATESATGDIRTSVRTTLLEAADLGAQGELEAAIERYDEVLEQQPSNVEALTYKGWYIFLSDASPQVESEVEALLDAAVVADPRFPDARVFRAVLFNDQGRYDEAAAEIAAFDSSDPPPLMVQLVEDQALRERILSFQLAADQPTGDLDPDELGITPDVLARAGRFLVAGDEIELAIRAFQGALDADPDNLPALLGRGELLVATGELIDEGVASLRRAVDVAPDSVEARWLLAQALSVQGDDAGALAELDALGDFELSSDLLTAVTQLRSSLEG